MLSPISIRFVTISNIHLGVNLVSLWELNVELWKFIFEKDPGLGLHPKNFMMILEFFFYRLETFRKIKVLRFRRRCMRALPSLWPVWLGHETMVYTVCTYETMAYVICADETMVYVVCSCGTMVGYMYIWNNGMCCMYMWNNGIRCIFM